MLLSVWTQQGCSGTNDTSFSQQVTREIQEHCGTTMTLIMSHIVWNQIDKLKSFLVVYIKGLCHQNVWVWNALSGLFIFKTIVPDAMTMNVSEMYYLFNLHTASIARLSVLGEGSLLCCSPWGFFHVSPVSPCTMLGSKDRGCRIVILIFCTNCALRQM